MQTQASQVKAVISGGRHTKIVVLGIGSSVSESELNAIASAPARKNVIRVQDFTSLMTVRDQLRDASCTGKLPKPNKRKLEGQRIWCRNVCVVNPFARWQRTGTVSYSKALEGQRQYEFSA